VLGDTLHHHYCFSYLLGQEHLFRVQSRQQVQGALGPQRRRALVVGGNLEQAGRGLLQGLFGCGLGQIGTGAGLVERGRFIRSLSKRLFLLLLEARGDLLEVRRQVNLVELSQLLALGMTLLVLDDHVLKG